MELIEILDKIENIIKNESQKSSENKIDSENHTDNNTAKDIIYLILQFFLSILKAPFSIITRYLKNEIITAIKKDAKLYALIMFIMIILFVFFSVLWLFISVAVGVYFQEKGHSILMSIIYSIGFQLISIIFISSIAFIASKKLKSLKMLKKFKKLQHKK
jgi:hypothetical protein